MRLVLLVMLWCVPDTLVAQVVRHSVALVGVVRDSATGEALPHARVLITEINRRTETNTDGRFALVDIPVASYTVRVQYIGYRPYRRSA